MPETKEACVNIYDYIYQGAKGPRKQYKKQYCDTSVVELKLRGQLNFNSFKDSGIATGLIKMSIKNENVHDYD